jgi:hypothetical protein
MLQASHWPCGLASTEAKKAPRTSSRPTANARPSAQFQANAGDSGNPARREATGRPVRRARKLQKTAAAASNTA